MTLKIRRIISCALMIFSVTAVSAQKRMTPQQYIDKYKDMAIEEMDIYGIPASIKLAQGLLESDCGNSRLAIEANNHFGIKCKADWTGPSILHDDDAKNECFRKYGSPTDSYRDHSEFLDKSARYDALFTLDIMDYKGWAHGLKAAGYATNPRYAELLIKVIEENNLFLYDIEWLEAESAAAGNIAQRQDRDGQPQTVVQIIEEDQPVNTIDVDNYVVSVRTIGVYPVYYNNGSEFIIARQGDTYEKLSQVSGVSSKKLRKFNDVPAGSQPKAGEQVYIRAKAKRANNGKLIHIAKDGDTLYSVSQMYGIKLNKLAAMNRRPADSKLKAGQQIRLM